MNTIDYLIGSYLNEVIKSIELFQSKIGRKDIMRACIEKQIPRKGIISNNLSYELHGIGCNFIYPDYEVDFDFAPGGRIDGIDYWRLKNFAEQFPDKYPDYQVEGALKRDFETLVDTGKLAQNVEYSSLYFLID